MRRISTAVFLFLVLFAAPSLRADVITVLKPTAGTYKVGTSMEISWTFQFMEWIPSTAAQNKVIVTLCQYDKNNNRPASIPSLDIASADVNAGHCSWIVEDLTTKWDGFLIKVWMKENPAIYAYSQPFLFEHAPLPRVPASAYISTIQVTSPTANQKCKMGWKVMISWNTNNISKYGYVWIQSCWPNHTPAGGAFTTNNTGNYEWIVSDTVENTLCFKISTQDNKFIGYSGNFKVVK